MSPGLMSSFGLLMAVLYACFMALMIGTWIYLLLKVGEISRNVASLAESVAVLARNSAAPKPEPPAPLVP